MGENRCAHCCSLLCVTSGAIFPGESIAMEYEETTPVLLRMQQDYTPGSFSVGSGDDPEASTKRRVNRVATTLCVAFLFTLVVAYIETESTLNEDEGRYAQAEAAMEAANRKRARADLDLRAAGAGFRSLEKQKKAVADVDQEQTSTRGLMDEEYTELNQLQEMLTNRTALQDQERAEIGNEQQELESSRATFWQNANDTQAAIDGEIAGEQQLGQAEDDEEQMLDQEQQALNDLETNEDALVNAESDKNAEDLEQQRKVFQDSQDRKIATQQQQDQKLTKVERELQLERSGVSEEQATKTKRNRVVCAQEAKLRQWKATHTANWDESQGGNVPGEARENSEYPCDPVDP